MTLLRRCAVFVNADLWHRGTVYKAILKHVA